MWRMLYEICVRAGMPCAARGAAVAHGMRGAPLPCSAWQGTHQHRDTGPETAPR